MWKNSISARVSRVIKQRVEAAQKEHDTMCLVIDKEAADRKEAHANIMVEKVLGK